MEAVGGGGQSTLGSRWKGGGGGFWGTGEGNGASEGRDGE